MNNYLKELSKTFSKGIVLGLGFLFIVGIVGITYSAFTTFTALESTNNEILTSTKWNNLVDAVKDEYSTSETLTSKTWMGKPVYRKVEYMDFSSITLNTNVYGTAIPGVVDIVNIESINYRNTGFVDGGNSRDNAHTDYYTIGFEHLSSRPYYILYDNRITHSYYIIEYTKN